MATKKKINSGKILHHDLEKIFPKGNANLISILFAPYLDDITDKNPVINSCPLEKFRLKFNITSDILDPMIDLWKEGKKFVLAGGKMIDFCLNKTMEESTNDYDLFFTSDHWRTEVELSLIGHDYRTSASLGYVTEYTSLETNRFNPIKLQTVCSVYANPEHILESFDIRVCAIGCDGERVYWVKKSLKDVRDKKIVMFNPRAGINMFERIHKYISKGYEIAVPDLAIASIGFLNAIGSLGVTFIKDSERLWDRDFSRAREFRPTYIEGETTPEAFEVGNFAAEYNAQFVYTPQVDEGVGVDMTGLGVDIQTMVRNVNTQAVPRPVINWNGTANAIPVAEENTPVALPLPTTVEDDDW